MRPSTVLFLAANPVATQALQLGEECRVIEDKIRKAKFRDQIRFRSRWAARPDDLLEALNEDAPEVLHFSGHGAGDLGLCFQSEDGRALSVSADLLARVMDVAGASVTVVVLNACYSEVQAEVLVAHVPCVIGMSDVIGDEAAIIYAGSFYRALASGMSVASAHEQGIVSLGLPPSGGQTRDINRAEASPCVPTPRLLTRPGIDAHRIYIVREPRKRVVVVIKATLKDFDAEVLARVTEELRQWTGDLSLQITDIDEGSVRLQVSLSPAAAARLVEMRASGQLTEICGFEVSAVIDLPEAAAVARARTDVAARRGHGGAVVYKVELDLVFGGMQKIASFFDRYQLVRSIGAGGMGSMYEANDLERAQKVALKVIYHSDIEKIHQLEREFRALADLSHPNLVALYDLVIAADACFVTMELLDSVDLLVHLWRPTVEDLADRVSSTPTELTSPPTQQGRNRPGRPIAMAVRPPWAGELKHGASFRVVAAALPPPIQATSCDLDRLRRALPQVARGLHGLHRAGKVHRDVKPSNIRVTSDGRVVLLLDVELVAELDGRQSGDGTIHGTVAYMAPEQCAGDVRLTAAADWYALGVVLFQALTGRLPFEGEPARILFDKQTEPAPRPSQLVPHIPRDLDDLCVELLERDPADRPTGPQLLRRLGVVP